MPGLCLAFFVFLDKSTTMKRFLYIVITCIVLIACNTAKHKNTNSDIATAAKNDTVSISNDELEYEIIIIEPGFATWLETRARPEGFYSQEFLENRNAHFVTAWNNRVINSSQYSPNLYEMQINYQQGIDYGYDVNYKLYNYFVYFQRKYNQQLTGFVDRY